MGPKGDKGGGAYDKSRMDSKDPKARAAPPPRTANKTLADFEILLFPHEPPPPFPRIHLNRLLHSPLFVFVGFVSGGWGDFVFSVFRF